MAIREELSLIDPGAVGVPEEGDQLLEKKAEEFVDPSWPLIPIPQTIWGTGSPMSQPLRVLATEPRRKLPGVVPCLNNPSGLWPPRVKTEARWPVPWWNSTPRWMNLIPAILILRRAGWPEPLDVCRGSETLCRNILPSFSRRTR